MPPPRPADERPLSPLALAVCVAVICAAGIAAYSNSFSCPFIFDDTSAIMTNRDIVNLWPLSRSMFGSDQTSIAGRPLVAFSLAINFTLSGLKVWSYHALNLLIHIIGALALFGILRRTLLRPKFKENFGAHAVPLALVCALIWLVHPLQTESVTYVVQRCESLMGMFFLLTLYFAIRGWDAPRNRLLWHALAVVACACGMGSKEVMVGAPLLVLLYDALFNAPPQRGLRFQPAFYVPLFATWIVLGLLLAAGGQIGASNLHINPISPMEYLRSQGGVICRYLQLTFYPGTLCLYYAWPVATRVIDIVPPCLFIAALVCVTGWGLWRGRAWAYCGAWFFLILAPTSSFLSIPDIAFEHRMYLPLAGVIVLVVLCVYRAGLRITSSPALQVALAVVVVAALGARTYARNYDYRSVESIWRSVLAFRPDNPGARNNLGDALFNAGKIEEAKVEFEATLKMQPNNIEAIDNMGNILNKEGLNDEAIQYYHRAIELRPDYALAYNNLGVVLLSINRDTEAMEAFKKILELEPENPTAHVNYGSVLDKMGHHTEALAQYNEAIRLSPDNPEAYANLGQSMANQGKFEEAIAYYQKALDLEPTMALSYLNMAIAKLRVGKKDEALKCVETTLQLQSYYPEAYLTKGAVLNEMGKFDDSIAAYKKALEQSPRMLQAAATASDLLDGAGRTDEAIAIWNGILEKTPDDGFSQFRVALLYARQKKSKEALEHLTLAAKFSATPDAHYALAEALRQSGRTDEALLEIREALRLAPENREAMNNLGRALLDAGRPDEAVTQLKTTVEKFPTFAPALLNLGWAYLTKRELTLAIENFELAIKLDPKLPDVRNFLRRAYIDRGDELEKAKKGDEALQLWTRASASSLDDPYFEHRAGRLLLNMGRINEAVTHFEAELKSGNADPVAEEDLGYALGRAGRKDEALKHLKEALTLQKENVTGLNNIARAMADLGMTAEAIDVFKDVIKQNPAYTDAYNNMAVAYSTLGKHEEALATFKEVLRLRPVSVDAERNLAICYGRLQNLPAAIEHFNRAIALDPKNADAREGLARLYAKNAKLPEAIAQFQELIRADPASPRGYVGLGTLLADSGKPDEAAAAFKDALKADPTDGPAHNSFGALLASRGAFDEAAWHFDAALKKNPNDALARENMSKVLRHLKPRP